MRKDQGPIPPSTARAQAAQQEIASAIRTLVTPETSASFQSPDAVRSPINGPDHFEMISPAEISKLTGGKK